MKTIELNLSRTIDASPEDVYDAWIDPNGPVSPWSGVVKAIVNPPQLNSLFYSMYQIQGYEYAHYGRFIALEKPKHIQYTWMSEGTRGLESVVTLNLKAEGDKTIVKITHSNLPDDEGGRRHEQAQGFLLSRISSHFGKKQNSK